ncbi:peptidase S24/S26A/S26B/S26C family protein isoform X2 [Tasmannia lanceolata]|uniref:peptidase S24/S26A/S26B/S26C family protein isoform X2 n=1 Tax=Tasmannia lanceolata TaxID=3420 RepID=UPI004064A13E
MKGMESIRNIVWRMRNAPHRRNAKEAMEACFLLAKFGCFIHVTNAYLCSVALVYGPSMLPTLNLTGDFILVDRLSTRFGRIGVGDIVLLRSPENPRKIVTKRVMAMEGAHVTFNPNPAHSYNCQTLVVPKGHVWVEGDNMYNSHDSRHFGAIPYGLLQGKAFCRIWPPSSFGPLE